MYKIVKRIVHTITTVTWVIRWEKGSVGEDAVEKEIVLPASHSRTEEVITDPTSMPAEIHHLSDSISDEGEKS